MDFNNSEYFELKETLPVKNNKKVKIFELKNNLEEELLNQWALSLRSFYIDEEKLELLMDEFNGTKEEYLQTYILPNKANPGPATMSGEFGEILIHDYICFIEQYHINKVRYKNKINPNVPVTGTDVIGYRIKDINKPGADDSLFIGEVKTKATPGSVNKEKINEFSLYKAIKDSKKDKLRIAESLHAEKSRLIDLNRKKEIEILTRFQKKVDFPYQEAYSAIAVIHKKIYSKELILDILNNIEIDDELQNILVIYVENLMDFVKDLYERAAKC